MMWYWKILLCLWLSTSQGSPSTTQVPETMTATLSPCDETNNKTRAYSERFPAHGHVKRIINLYLIPLLLLFGTIGNVMSFIIYSQPAFSQSMTSFLFRVLAVTDTMALNYGLWNNWLNYLLGRSLFQKTVSYCKIDVYLRYLLPDIPVWILVLVAIERVIGVAVPHRARLIVTKGKLVITLVGIFLFLVAYNSPVLMAYTSTAHQEGNTTVLLCKSHLSWKKVALTVFPWMDLIMYSILPLSLMFISSMTIIVIILKRKKFLATRGTRTREANTLTFTLLMVCLAFMLLTIPHNLYALLAARYYRTHCESIDFLTWWFIVGFFRYVNNAINFFLYCMSGRPFRRELSRLFGRNPRAFSREYSAMSTQMSVISKTSSYR